MSTYTGHILRVNLSSGTISKESVPEALQRKLVGGRGFGAGYLFEEMRPGIEPLSEDNPLIFMPGVLAGTKANGFGRWIVMT
jgi:aldehyde:ferredoxin oxidoreductase